MLPKRWDVARQRPVQGTEDVELVGRQPLLSMYPSTLESTSLGDDGTLHLSFDNVGSISVPPHAVYEAWQVSRPSATAALSPSTSGRAQPTRSPLTSFPSARRHGSSRRSRNRLMGRGDARTGSGLLARFGDRASSLLTTLSTRPCPSEAQPDSQQVAWRETRKRVRARPAGSGQRWEWRSTSGRREPCGLRGGRAMTRGTSSRWARTAGW